MALPNYSWIVSYIYALPFDPMEKKNAYRGALIKQQPMITTYASMQLLRRGADVIVFIALLRHMGNERTPNYGIQSRTHGLYCSTSIGSLL